MRIESVTAHAFGPFADETLAFSPGMTVVYGPNESGKSSWHAALYSAICGMRRGRGRAMKDDEDFMARHRPWNENEEWEVSAIITLGDGRRIELHHDLDSKTGSAHDADLGRDYSSEIVNDGAPDGAIWLGLDRRSFLSTACVRQADVQAIEKDANELQVHMQRAASTAGADETAAVAIKAIQDFNRDNVGQDRRNSTKPLRAAKDRFQIAQDNRQAAQEAHDEYVANVGNLETLEAQAAQAEVNRRIVEAAVARTAAEKTQGDLERAHKLSSKCSHDPAPEHDRQGKMAQQGKLALYSWKNRPEPVDLTGPNAEELQRQLDELPPMPEGDTEPHQNVVNAKSDYEHAQRSLRGHRDGKPTEPAAVNTGGLTSEKLRSIASELSLEERHVDAVLRERVDQAQAKVDGFEEKDARKPSGPFAWLLRLIAVIFGAIFGKREDDSHARLQAEKELAAAKDDLGEVQFEVRNIRQRKTAAANKAAEHGLPSDVKALGTLASRAEAASEMERDLGIWHKRESNLKDEADQAEQALAEALHERGSAASQLVTDTLAAYESACKERSEQLREASRRVDLEKLLEARKGKESDADEAEKRRNEAVDELRQAAKALEFQEEAVETLVARLSEWIKGYEAEAPERQGAVEEWSELRNLLGGGGIEALESVAEKTRKAADTAAQGLEEQAIDAAVLEADTEAQLRELRFHESECKDTLSTERGGLEVVARRLPSVAEAEEEVERAKAEHERVANLGNILSKTEQFLKRAEGEVHRDIAPHLVKALTPWIKSVTGGRYSSVKVDPQDLKVRVSGDGGELRDATLLSHGTTEQVYSLLRVAMADLLTKESGESCPLLLDDVTVHCDPERQTAILDLLLAISAERQVILFSQEPETLAWAQQHPQEVHLVELDPGSIPA